MKMFFFYINGICGLEDWLDRELVFPISELYENPDKLCLVVSAEGIQSLKKLVPNKSYAIQFEHTGGHKELKYYYLMAFEVLEPSKNSTDYDIILYTKSLDI